MFSQGQIIFGVLFFIAFVIVTVFMYRKDVVTHKQYYKGSYKVLIGFLLFVAFLFVIKFYGKGYFNF